MPEQYIPSGNHSNPVLPSWQTFTVNAPDANTAVRVSRGEIDRGKKVILHADDANSADITIGPNEDADFSPLIPGQEYDLPANSEFDVDQWYFKSTAANQNLKVLFI